ncbi:bifunctional folylpolyglutamate synthase/dihydrofolate synthase [Prochlorococcus sp. MIT 1341]|uniref:bifunctional folylpolyglutamate synthase/dihydrofolate synthase n=1 Tax=Prochlorococcus sp. MIT 1341 TaxID=3096221 RepID=UPI002A75ED1E|nr:Mur ligase family protein [Prochlorococcus sp. MIT 1341]
MSDSSKENLEDEFNSLIEEFSSRGVDLNIERMTKVIRSMGNLCAEIPAIQVVGTNGKGSIATLIESALKSSGIKAGITTSPHLVNWEERIRVNGEMIESLELISRLKGLRKLARKENLTPFEFLLAAAFDYFYSQKVDIMVLEVGLGGRLDATTAHPNRPIIALGSIGMDHHEFLGKTLEDIALEKIAVVTEGSFVVSAQQEPMVKKIIERKVKEKNAKLKWVKPLEESWKIGLPGKIQLKNAAVAKGALEALTALGWDINQKDIKEGFARANWPGRLQSVYWRKCPLIIDGAHNSQAMEQLSEERKSWQNQENGVTWILAIQAKKEAPKMLRTLLSKNDIAWILPIPNHLSWTKHQLENACPELSKQMKSADSVEECLKKLEGEWPNPPPVISGSLYLLGNLFSQNIITTVNSKIFN